jgi:LysR family transcriptional regulator, benzoate and cis,cis-muconate-responsive activator of ben and cat genes
VELRHLRYLVATVDAGTASAAAARLHVTQPALSRQLRDLERELGVDLFDRRAGRLALSPTGSALLPAAREVLAAAERLRTDAAFHAEGGLRRLTIAAPTVTLTDVVSPFVATMADDDPVVDVRSADGQSATTMLGRGADLAIGTDRPTAPYAARELAVLPVWAYVRSDDPWADRRTVDLDELLGRVVIGLPTTYTAREALEAAVAASGAAYAGLIEAANGTIAQALAAAGRGVALVSDDPRYDLVPLKVTHPGGALSITLVAAWDARSPAATALERLARRLGEWVAAHYGAPTAPQGSVRRGA